VNDLFFFDITKNIVIMITLKMFVEIEKLFFLTAGLGGCCKGLNKKIHNGLDISIMLSYSIKITRGKLIELTLVSCYPFCLGQI